MQLVSFALGRRYVGDRNCHCQTRYPHFNLDEVSERDEHPALVTQHPLQASH